MTEYKAQHGYPKADLSFFDDVAHVLPPDESSKKDEHSIPRFTHDYALKKSTIEEYPEKVSDEDLREEVESRDEIGEDLFVAVVRHFALDRETVPCNDCGTLIWVDQWRGSYASHQCPDCNALCSQCGEPLSETKEVVRTSRSIRTPTKYKCTNCGNRWRGITTG